MRFGQKMSSGPTFGQKVAHYASRFGHKVADILRKGQTIGTTIGESVLPFSPAFGAEIIAISSLAGHAGKAAGALANTLEKHNNNHNRLM